MALERKLLEAQRLESLGVMAAGIAHDFNNILTTILGNADLALLSPALDRPTRHSLQAVLEGAHRAAELTRQILAYAGKGQILLQPTDLSLTVAGLEELLFASAGQRSRLTITPGEGLPRVAADSAQLRQVLLNLVINAGEAIEVTRQDGTIDVRTGVEQLARAELDGLIHGAELPAGTYVRLTVEDNGGGMDAATAARIFDPFFSTRFLGRGLGLAAVQGIVRAHRGAMRVESVPGAGTSFSIWLPALAPGGEGHGERPGRRGSALLLEADPAARELIAGLLRQLELGVVAADDSAAALARLAAGLPELEAAIVAHDAPGLRAELVAEAIDSLRPGTPVLRIGAGGLQRPVTMEALREALGTALARKSASG
jgi:nitrogen-specific signal transduction histidine kinase/CheY-like chemotaxis protein